MRNPLLSSAVVVAAAAAVACSPDSAGVNSPQAVSAPMHSVLLDAPFLVAQAAQGVKKRGEQDEMVKIENSVPGFGGFFFDSTDKLTVYMKGSSPVSAAAAQAALNRAYSQRTEAPIRARMSGAATARVIPGDYSLSELIAAENRIAYPRFRLPGFVGVGVSIAMNRVKVGFSDPESLSQGLAVIADMGVPTSMLIPEVWRRPAPLSTFNDMLRPIFGGIQIGIMNRDSVPWDGVVNAHDPQGSIGYDVHTAAGVHYLLTAAHLANTFRGVNGLVGDTILQKGHHDYPHGVYPIGVVAINPPWDTAAAACDSAGVITTFCSTADAMLVRYLPGVAYIRGVGVSTYEGLHGNPGSSQIREAWAIADVWPPEMVRTGIVGVHKSGATTGTTTGILDLPRTEFSYLICMDKWDAREENFYPPDQCNFGAKSFRISAAVKVNTALAAGGDSGGPVFAGNGSPYHALGITTAASTNCTGDECYFIFSKWSEIEAWLGQGPLNPVTSQ